MSSEVSIDLKLDAVVIPVSDVDRAKEFYSRLGWRLDADFRFENGFRVVQLTPPGSGASVQFGTKITSATPGSAQGLYLVVSDITAARSELAARGIEISEVFHPEAPGAQFRSGQIDARATGSAPNQASYGSFATFNDPDGNTWLLQEVTNRLPERVTGDVAYTSKNDLIQALIRAATAHGKHEQKIGQTDPEWPVWYAEYMLREQSGEELPQ